MDGGVSIEDLVDAVTWCVFDGAVAFHRNTGVVVTVADSCDVTLPDAFDAQDPAWIWVPLPDEDTDGRTMLDFARSRPEARSQARLLQQLDRPRPFRHFRQELDRQNLAAEWNAFHSARLREELRAWLRAEGHPFRADDTEACEPGADAPGR